MPVTEILVSVVVALLAVLGLRALLLSAFSIALCPRELAVALILTDQPAPEELDLLLSEATHHPAYRRGQRVVVMLTADAAGKAPSLSPALIAVAERYQAELYATRPLPDP